MLQIWVVSLLPFAKQYAVLSCFINPSFRLLCNFSSVATLSICSCTIEIASLWSTVAACHVRVDCWRLVQPSMKAFFLPARKHVETQHSCFSLLNQPHKFLCPLWKERAMALLCFSSWAVRYLFCLPCRICSSLRAWLHECIKHCLLSQRHFGSGTSHVLPWFQCSSFIIAHASDPVSLIPSLLLKLYISLLTSEMKNAPVELIFIFLLHKREDYLLCSTIFLLSKVCFTL